jgi:hypothetical protein
MAILAMVYRIQSRLSIPLAALRQFMIMTMMSAIASSNEPIPLMESQMRSLTATMLLVIELPFQRPPVRQPTLTMNAID